MRRKLCSALLAVVLALTILTLAPPFSGKASAAAPAVTLDVDTGGVGDKVLVSGTGTAFSTFYRIRWASATGTSLATGTTTAGGTLSKYVNIPEAASGDYQIFVLVTGEPNASAVFTVTPEISISVDNGRGGESFTVTGTGFGASETGITIQWDGVKDLATSIKADSKGSWSKTVTVPAATNGNHVLSAFGDDLSLTPDVNFSVGHNLSISPSTGNTGTTVTVSGMGFYASETGIQVLWDSVGVKSGITADAYGSWSSTFNAPASAAGGHTITAKGATTTSSQVPSKTFTTTRSMSISPTSGPAGVSVTVTGSGFAASSALTVTVDGAAVTTTPASPTSAANGAVSLTFVMPGAAPGAHTVKVADSGGNQTAAFTITSSMSISPETGPVGSQVTVTGVGYPTNATMEVWFDSARVTTSPASLRTDANGGFSATFAAPESARGTHTVKAVAGTTSLTKNFNTTASVAADPTSGAVGSSVKVSGKGYAAGATIVLTYDGYAAATSPATVQASNLGSFSATIVLPASARGPHNIDASDGTASMRASVSITPTANAAGTTFKAGDKIPVAGNGFGAGSAITVTIDSGIPASLDKPSLAADINGGFSVQVTVPEGAFGTHKVNFSDGVAAASVSYSITPVFNISPNNGSVGTTVTLSGTGYSAGSPISVTYGGVAITPAAPIKTTAAGSFQGTVVVPPSKGGQHVLAVADAASHVMQAAFTMETSSPAAPQPVALASGSRVGTFGPQTPTFTWSPIADPSGVTYTLQVSKDASFLTPLLEKTNLKDPAYELEDAEALKRGYYYWRVKATDGASNESGWSQTFALSVGILPPWMSMWMFIGLVVVILGLLGAAGYLLVASRRSV